MNTTGIEQLTQRQKECLRLVRRDRGSKEIAKALSLSHHTVNKYIEEARHKLGARDRFHAARMFGEHEHGPDYDPFAYDPLGVAEPGPDATVAPSFQPARADPDGDGHSLQEAPPALAYTADSLRSHQGRRREFGGKRNDLTATQRIRLIGLYAIGFLLAIALLATVADSLFRMLARVFA